MTSEAEQKFQNFDFSTDLSWKEFEHNIFPVPPADKLDRIKRKWFHKNIDSSLPETISSNTDSTTSANTDSNSTSQNSQSTRPSQPSAPRTSIAITVAKKIANVIGGPVGKVFDIIHATALPMKEKFFFLEGVLKFVFILSAFLIPQFANMIAFNVCMLGFLRQTGRPRWNLEYGQAAMQNEFLQNLLYMVPFAFFPNQKTLVYYLPLGIHFWVGFCEFANLKLPTIYPKIAKVADFTRQNRALLMSQKAKSEIMLFVFLVILLFFRGSNLIIIFFYGNFLKTKYLINPATQAAFKEINTWVEGKTNSPYCPGIIKMIVNKSRGFCEYLVKK